ncbi:DUF4358 domain-containing protein [Clostridium aestuarii]|uniref:DUF4358 domain-containing protein n=1 Tax=Clostridium aestuarii TaxID=338193 RepID=A0ABT4CYS3_9CLOT|nr:DUF4358 domain-containing protein [Clostridium aestuarii]MCY6484121.1 DUF4358 domain-containing protein [Clostridium aestuarii]
MTKILKATNKNIFITIILLISTVSFLAGCSNSKNSADENVSVKDINEKVKQTIDVSEMREGDGEKLQKLYDINPEDLEEFVFYTPPSNIKADELIIMKVKDSDKIDDIKEKISKRIEQQGSNFKDYLPEEYYLIEKHVLKDNGNYILLTVSKDAEKIEDIFDEAFK